MSDIKQIRVSESIKLFKPGIKKLYGLRDYVDLYAPAFFWGVYTKQDITAINNHRGYFKVVRFGGIDMRNIEKINPSHIMIDMWHYQQLLLRYTDKKINKFMRVGGHDPRDITVEPPGNKIYCYINQHSKIQHYQKGLINNLKEIYGGEIIFGIQGHTRDETIEKYYKRSFVNIQFNSVAGMGTQIDMAHMGRPSISNYPAPWCYGYNSIEDICKGIEKARTLSDKSRERIAKQVNKYFDYSGEWLNLAYWGKP